MKRYAFLLAFTFVAWSTGYAQNGIIVEKTPIILTDSTYNKIKEAVPNIGSILGLTNFYHIIYQSDGLRVKGYLAVPRATGTYPCVIYN